MRRSNRAYNFHKNTLFVLKELLEAVGATHPVQLNRRHIVKGYLKVILDWLTRFIPKQLRETFIKKKRGPIPVKCLLE